MNPGSPPRNPGEAWTPKSLLDWSARFFSEKKIPSPRLDAELLLSHVLDCKRIDLYLQFDRPLHEAELAAYRELVQGRARRIPVAYLTGWVGFRDLTLAIGEGCLVPRPETETLVDVCLDAIALLRAQRASPAPLVLAEVGTGSGAIPLAVCAEAEGLRWVSCDLSGAALVLAKKNLAALRHLLAPRGNAVYLVRARGGGAFRSDFRPELVVSNPPYIPTGQLDGLEPEVSRAEPRLALDGGPDGMEPQRELMAYAAAALRPGGRLVFEFGAGQAEALRGLLQAHPALELVEIRDDLAGRERVFHARRREG